MKLIIILIALFLQLQLKLGDKFTSARYFQLYASLLQRLGNSALLTSKWSALFTALLPSVIILLLLQVLGLSFYGLPRFVIATILLVMCLSRNFALPHPINSAQLSHIEHLPSALTWQHNSQLFAVLFWFILLGAGGAVFYTLLREIEHSDFMSDNTTKSLAHTIHGILDFPTSRIIGLGYALAGNFAHTFPYWLKQSFPHSLLQPHQDYLLESCEFLASCAQCSLNLTSPETLTDDKQPAQALVKRTLIIFLAIIALGTFIGLTLA